MNREGIVMDFKRFGNAFIARDNGGNFYVVSNYLDCWHAYTMNQDGSPREIGKYGHGGGQSGLDNAKQAAIDFAYGSNTA